MRFKVLNTRLCTPAQVNHVFSRRLPHRWGRTPSSPHWPDRWRKWNLARHNYYVDWSLGASADLMSAAGPHRQNPRLAPDRHRRPANPLCPSALARPGSPWVTIYWILTLPPQLIGSQRSSHVQPPESAPELRLALSARDKEGRAANQDKPAYHHSWLVCAPVCRRFCKMRIWGCVVTERNIRIFFLQRNISAGFPLISWKNSFTLTGILFYTTILLTWLQKVTIFANSACIWLKMDKVVNGNETKKHLQTRDTRC